MFNETMLLFMYYLMFYFVDGGIINGTPTSTKLSDQITFNSKIDSVFISIGFILVLFNFYFFVLVIRNNIYLNLLKRFNLKEHKIKI